MYNMVNRFKIAWINFSKCFLSMDFFDDAVITNCQHTFCRKCIENYIGSKRTQSCPLCKNTINLRSLKQFSSLDPFISKTKILEEKFAAEMSAMHSVKTPNKNKIDPISIESEQEKNSFQSSSDFSVQILKSRQKKRTISSVRFFWDKWNLNYWDIKDLGGKRNVLKKV